MSLQGFRLSPQQKHLWEMQHIQPAHCVQGEVRLEGLLNREALRSALRRIIERHEILRTKFCRRPGLKIPLQVIEEAAAVGDIVFRELSLSPYDTDERSGIERVFSEQRNRAFDFEVAPLFEADLLELAPERHVLLLRLPALCADAVSLSNLVRELAAHLAPESELAAQLEPDEEVVQFLQFSEWKNEIVAAEDGEAGAEHWRQQDTGSLPSLKLPFERLASNGHSFQPTHLSVRLESDLIERVEMATAGAGAPPSVFLLACWQILLWRLTGEPRFAIGHVFDGRKFEDLERAVGLFAQAVPLAASFEPGLRFDSVLRRLHQGVQEAYNWQEFFSPAEGDGLWAAAFETSEMPADLTANGLSLGLERIYTCSARFRLKLACRFARHSWDLEIQYDPVVLLEEDVRALALQLTTLVASAAEEPLARIEDLRILGEEERRALLVEFNGTRVDWPSNRLVHQEVEIWAARIPERSAVVFEDIHLSYGDLNALANRLAHHLVRLGVKSDTPVAILLDRSADLVVALLAVLKAGGAFVPLDPRLPKLRLELLLRQTGTPVVLTQELLRERLPELAGATVVSLDGDGDEIAGRPDVDPGVVVQPENLAYILFTSGSTGLPKAVSIEHRQIANYWRAVAQRLALPAESSYALVSSPAADLGNTVLFPALCGGGSLHLLSQDRVSDPEAFADYFGRHAISCLKIVPSHLSNLLTAASPERVLPRQVLVLGGEASPRTLVRRIRELAPECRILNHYGPTETTVGVVTHEVLPGEEALPLGRPLANLRLYLVDAGMRPVATGVPGELLIGGAGVARGYLGRPELTAEKFLPDGLSGVPGARLYRSGDLARFLSRGELEFLGRADHQVKVRGFRVELGEIEAALLRQGGIREAVVLLREDTPGEHRLTGYVVPQAGSEIAIEALRGALQQELPDHMVPAAFVRLDSLPLTPNGKVDRRALPRPEDSSLEKRPERVSPRALGEEMLAGIWSEVLKVHQLGVHDNFFALGGDSLLATQLISRVRRVFQVDLPVRALFEAPTVSSLSARVQRVLRGERGLEVPPIEPTSRNGDLPLSFGQERLWILHQLDPHKGIYNSISPVRLQGPLDEGALKRALDEIVRRHEILRTRIESVDGRPLQVVEPPSPLPVARIDLELLSESQREMEVQRIASGDCVRPFDLTRPPLLRVTLLRLVPEGHVALFTLHHIVSDGWSVEVLVHELTCLYHAFRQGRPSPLPELPVQYADFAVWQRSWLQGEVLDRLLAYWTRHLAGAPDVLALPTDYPRPKVQTFRGGNQLVRRSPEVLALLKELSRQEGATLFMTVLAAFYVLLHLYTEQEDIVVGTDIANRNRFETEGLIGFFVNNLPLRVDLSGDPSFRELLGRVRTMAIGAYGHQDMPFSTLVKALQLKRSLSHTPLFQTLFVFQNMPPASPAMGELEMSMLNEVELSMVKFDLALFVSESEAGLTENWTYSTELFKAATIDRMVGHFQTVLETIVQQPDAPVGKLEIFTEAERKMRSMERIEHEKSKLRTLGRSRRSSVDLSEMELVRTETLAPDRPLPVVVKPNLQDIDIVEWAQGSREFIEGLLLKHGAILFRGFNLGSVKRFEEFAQAACTELFANYGDLPREEEADRVYHSTPYPNEKTILFHNESSHMHRWPTRQFFHCVIPAERGGETPIVDCRQMHAALPREIIDQFEQKKVMYVRNFTEGLDVSWQHFFKTDEREEVEAYCRRANMELEWKSDGLRTRQICRAVAKHPKTGEDIFFNQLQLHHVSCLEPEVREALFSIFTMENLPRYVCYGDGTPIEDSVMQVISDAYWQNSAAFRWEQGDVLMVDNMLIAHARNPFWGSRKIVVAMGDMLSESEL